LINEVIKAMGRRKKYLEPRVTTAVRIPESLHRQLQETADARDTSVNHLIMKAARHYLANLPPLGVDTDEKATV
jgi:predicted HicB family RNase H-like nuclease